MPSPGKTIAGGQGLRRTALLSLGTALGLAACAAPVAHFAQTGAHQPPLPAQVAVRVYHDSPPLPPFAELGLLALPCRALAACLEQARVEARRHGGNALIVTGRPEQDGSGLAHFVVIQRDPRLP